MPDIKPDIKDSLIERLKDILRLGVNELVSDEVNKSLFKTFEKMSEGKLPVFHTEDDSHTAWDKIRASLNRIEQLTPPK
jgi:hypothetical protein